MCKYEKEIKMFGGVGKYFPPLFSDIKFSHFNGYNE
jgi:hypothetical protein